MNKIMTVAIIAGGLLLLDSPEAAAHKQVRNGYQPSAHYHVDHRRFDHRRFEHRRPKHMPYWLKRNREFRRWFRHSHLRRHRHIAWHRVYEIFLWERFYATNHRRGDRYYRGDRYSWDYDHDSDHDSDRRRRRHH